MNLISDPIFLVELAMLSALLSVGLYVSYTDIQRRWIPNRFTFALLAIGLVGQGVMVNLGVTTWSQIVVIFLTGLGMALLLILLGFWSPGDAKLFWAGVVALPPSIYPRSDMFSLQAAPVVVLFNALLCYLVVLLLVPLWRREWHKEDGERPIGKKRRQAAAGQAGLVGLILGFAVLVLEGPLSYLEVFAALVIGYRLLERCVPVGYWSIVVIPGLIAFIYLGQVTGGWSTYVLFWGIAWLVELIYLQVRFQYGRAFVQTLPISLLQPGVLLREALHFRLTGDEEFHGQANVPLSEQQVNHLRELEHQGLLPEGKCVEIEQSMPFVPFIVGAIALTAIFSGSLMPPLRWLVMWMSGYN